MFTKSHEHAPFWGIVQWSGQRALNPPIQVRVLVSQPSSRSTRPGSLTIRWDTDALQPASASSRGAITTSLRYSALAQRQCTGLLRQEIQVRVLGAELCTFVVPGQSSGYEGAETGLSDGFRALPCKQSHGSSTLHSSTEWADRQGLSPSDCHSDCGVIRFPSLLLPAFASVVQRPRPQSSKLVMWVQFPPLALGCTSFSRASRREARRAVSLRWWNRNTHQPQKLGP